MKKNEKQPQDHILCPRCNRPYGFIACRVTLKNPTRNICLRCAAAEEHDKLGAYQLKKTPMSDDNNDVLNPEVVETPAVETPAEEVAEAAAPEAAAE